MMTPMITPMMMMLMTTMETVVMEQFLNWFPFLCVLALHALVQLIDLLCKKNNRQNQQTRNDCLCLLEKKINNNNNIVCATWNAVQCFALSSVSKAARLVKKIS